MTKKELIDYCERHDVFVPTNASKEYLEAAIVKAAEHQGKVERPNCFGYWMPEHGSCLVCDLQRACSHSALGMDTDKYMKAVRRLENPRIRTAEKLTKKRNKKRMR